MAKLYRISPLAEADLEEIWFYTCKRWSIEQADSYLQKLVAACEELAAGTKQGRPTVTANIQKYLCGSHVVYFLDYADRVDVVRILHQRQDAERHF